MSKYRLFSVADEARIILENIQVALCDLSTYSQKRWKQGWVNVFPHALPLFSYKDLRKHLITSRCVFPFIYIYLLSCVPAEGPSQDVLWGLSVQHRGGMQSQGKAHSSAEQCTAKLILSNKSLEQYIIHACPCTVNRRESSIEFVEMSCTSTERIWVCCQSVCTNRVALSWKVSVVLLKV